MELPESNPARNLAVAQMEAVTQVGEQSGYVKLPLRNCSALDQWVAYAKAVLPGRELGGESLGNTIIGVVARSPAVTSATVALAILAIWSWRACSSRLLFTLPREFLSVDFRNQHR